MTRAARSAQADETVLANARLVLEHEIRRGALVIRDGLIAEMDDLGSVLPKGAVDLEGDLLAPGLIELHTDNLERHLQPRPGVHWPLAAAVVAHDAEFAGCGVTTVFDALRIGSMRAPGRTHYGAYARGVASEIGALSGAGMLQIRHRLHLRAEICSETLEEELAEFAERDRVGIVSVMDHTPGQRQFGDVDRMRSYIQGRHGLNDAEFDAHVARLQALGARVGARHAAAVVAGAGRLGAVLASHDDTTEDQVAVSAANGARIAEFPTTLSAARASRTFGVAVMAGAPNLLRGGSHSGNVAARTLAEDGVLDILSSDYAPASLLQSALQFGRDCGDMARGFAAVTSAPARAAGFDDRGRLALGLKADLTRIRLHGDLPLVRGVWVGGARVA